MNENLTSKSGSAKENYTRFLINIEMWKNKKHLIEKIKMQHKMENENK